MVRDLTDLDRLVMRHTGLARLAARRLKRKFASLPLEDLESWCLMGVAKACERLDEGFDSVSGYIVRSAYWWGLREAMRVRKRGFTMLNRRRTPKVVTAETGCRLGLATRGDPVIVLDGRDWDRLLAPLKEKDRELLIARFCEELGHEEIAARFGYASAKSARAMVGHALERLRNNLDPEYWAPEAA